MDSVLLELPILKLPVIQGISPYLEMKDLLILRLASKSFNSAVSSGEMKLSGTMQFKHPIREEALAMVACVASKKLSFYNSTSTSEPLDTTFVHNMLMMSQYLSELIMMNDDIPDGYQYPQNITFRGRCEYTFKNFGAFQNVTHLRIYNSSVEMVSLTELLKNEHLPRIRKLKISSQNITIGVIDAISKLSGLERLTITRTDADQPMNRDCAYALGSLLNNMQNLKRLHLRGIGIDSVKLERFIEGLRASLGKHKHLNLEGLKLDQNIFGYLTPVTECFVEIGNYMPLLEVLHLGNCQLDCHSGKTIAALIRKLPKLKTLTLGSNSIGPRRMEEIIDALPSTVEELYLHGCLDGEAEKHLFANALMRHMSTNTHLWGLGLNGNYFNGRDMCNITKCLPPTLRDIGITNVYLTDEYMGTIGCTIAQRCPVIRFVYLYTKGFKAAESVTKNGLVILQNELAKTSGILVSDHSLSRYIKHA